jgi:NAD(P)-dependent dehydrogenase (short-subunit alcohol dehydrogenase family)
MNEMNQNTSRKIAIVTGGGTGLGLASALEFQRLGYRVIALGLDIEPELEGSGVEFEKLDISDEKAMQDVADRFSQINLLVNSAGIILHEGKELTVPGFRKVVDVNLHGTHLACLMFHKALAARRGSIVNFASMWSFFGSANNPGYSASKGAVVSLTRSLAVGFAPDGVRVNAVAPGWIETRMSQKAFNDPERSGSIQKRIPIGCWGKPVDIAKAVAFLASDDARYITGVILPIDGGYSVA